MAQKSVIEVIHSDITQLDVDAIVNAANHSLLGGGGVDGAIHLAAGPELLEFCRGMGGCKTGEAKCSPGFRLKARWVIHTVGPVWAGGQEGEAESLASCYQNSLALAEQIGAAEVAFPAISTGVFGFPVMLAAEVACHQVKLFLPKASALRKVFLVCFSREDTLIFKKALLDS